MQAAKCCVNCGSLVCTEKCETCGRPLVLDNIAYLNDIEELGQTLILHAFQDNVLVSLSDESDMDRTPFDLALVRLARKLKHYHYENDGCLKLSSSKEIDAE